MALTESVSANVGSKRVIERFYLEYSADKADDDSGYCYLYLTFRVTKNNGLTVVCAFMFV